MLENRIVLEEYNEETENYENYLEYLNEEDDRRYEDKIFERMEEK